MSWKITVERVDNGFIIRDEDPTEPVTVHEWDDGPTDMTDAAAKALWEIIERLSMRTSRYAEKRIYVEVQPGDKYIAPGTEL